MVIHGSTISFSKEEIQNAIKERKTMGGAARFLKVDWRTFKKEAEKYDLYKPQRGPGIKYELEDILGGLHPQYPTSKLNKRLIKEGYLENVCIECGIPAEYNEKPISLELDHIDGNNSNHSLHNLRLLCPNCHSQTDTYRSKKLVHNNWKK